MLIIGLTGGIGSGKSAAADRFRSHGITVIDADQVARQAVEKGSEALHLIAEHFGSQILLDDGNLNRALLRQIIFDNPEEKQWLEALLHPIIRQLTKEQLNAAESPYAVLESPLLLETNQHELVSRVIVVDVPEQAQLERACARDANSEEQIKAIMSSQMSRDKRLGLADDRVDNSGSLEALCAQVDQLHQTYLDLAAS